jgi:hypothetical protein
MQFGECTGTVTLHANGGKKTTLTGYNTCANPTNTPSASTRWVFNKGAYVTHTNDEPTGAKMTPATPRDYKGKDMLCDTGVLMGNMCSEWSNEEIGQQWFDIDDTTSGSFPPLYFYDVEVMVVSINMKYDLENIKQYLKEFAEQDERMVRYGDMMLIARGHKW